MNLRAGPGSLLGLPALVGNQPYTLTAIVLRCSVVGYVSRRDFEATVRAEPSLSLNVCQVLAAEVRSARQALSRK
jgi:CRP-like cAMP-binding protein